MFAVASKGYFDQKHRGVFKEMRDLGTLISILSPAKLTQTPGMCCVNCLYGACTVYKRHNNRGCHPVTDISAGKWLDR